MIQFIRNWFFGWVDSYMHRKYGNRKSLLFEDHPDSIIEIGPGYGANFRYLRKGTKIMAVEPDESFHPVLKFRANKYGINLEIYKSKAEEMPFSGNTSSMVIGSLVLCSVDDPPKVLSEIKRVLKPEGIFVFLEHVKAAEHSWIYKAQHVFKGLWSYIFDGCIVTRETEETIRNSGFSRVEIESFHHRTLFIPIIPHIAGKAVK